MQQGRSDEAEPHFSRSIAPLLNPTDYPEYQSPCLAAAAGFYRTRSDSERVARIEAALAGLDSEVPIEAAVNFD